MSAILSFFVVVHNRGSPIEKHSTSRTSVYVFHSEGDVVPFINLVNYSCEQQDHHFRTSTEIEKTEKSNLTQKPNPDTWNPIPHSTSTAVERETEKASGKAKKKLASHQATQPPDSCTRPYLYSVMLLLPVGRGTHWITTATGLPSVPTYYLVYYRIYPIGTVNPAHNDQVRYPGLDRNAQVIVTLRRPAPAERTYDRPSRAVTACHWASQNRTKPPKYNDFGATRLQNLIEIVIRRLIVTPI
ncbi:hypothetical protein NEUTE2DRAFT_60152 [Neurospora tetrasperma FGSC 2509]|nr:hypothetical protein NEUTE2DRAFT_60152 [Neurospora tetrasperma FGSC 2509]